MQRARPDEDDEHEHEGVDVAEEVERRDARLRHKGYRLGAWSCKQLLECCAGLVLGHEGGAHHP